MILDSSAVIAILRNETEAPGFAKAIESFGNCRVSAVSYVEAAAVIDRGGDAVAKRRFDDFFRTPKIALESVTPRQAEIARAAYHDFGNGRHRANLNFGDCFAYALAKDLDEPLLFKGDDFVHTDIESAMS